MKKYVITEEKLIELIERDNELLRLESYGVDNWQGYEYAFKDEYEEVSAKDYIKENFEEVKEEKEE